MLPEKHNKIKSHLLIDKSVNKLQKSVNDLQTTKTLKYINWNKMRVIYKRVPQQSILKKTIKLVWDKLQLTLNTEIHTKRKTQYKKYIYLIFSVLLTVMLGFCIFFFNFFNIFYFFNWQFFIFLCIGFYLKDIIGYYLKSKLSWITYKHIINCSCGYKPWAFFSCFYLIFFSRGFFYYVEDADNWFKLFLSGYVGTIIFMTQWAIFVNEGANVVNYKKIQKYLLFFSLFSLYLYIYVTGYLLIFTSTDKLFTLTLAQYPLFLPVIPIHEIIFIFRFTKISLVILLLTLLHFFFYLHCLQFDKEKLTEINVFFFTFTFFGLFWTFLLLIPLTCDYYELLLVICETGIFLSMHLVFCIRNNYF